MYMYQYTGSRKVTLNHLY